MRTWRTQIWVRERSARAAKRSGLSERSCVLEIGFKENFLEFFRYLLGTVRLLSEHAPHFRGRSLYGGSHIRPLGKDPTRASDYRKGRVFAFIIEFLTVAHDKPGVDFRIYLQGSAANAGQGLPPTDLREFDLAVLAAAGHHEVCGYPESILKRLRPKHLMVSHWEDFFASPQKPLRTVRGTDVRRFLDRVDETRKELPDLGPSRLLARGRRAVYPVRGAEN